jgi:hypothetical protein
MAFTAINKRHTKLKLPTMKHYAINKPVEGLAGIAQSV